MVDSILDNLSLRTQRKAEIRLELGLETTSGILEQFIYGIKKILDHPQVEELAVFLEEIKPNAFLVHTDFYTAPIVANEFNELKQHVNLEILKLMGELKIELAGAGHDVRISGKVNL